MDKYQRYTVTVRTNDRSKADAIIDKHDQLCEFDELVWSSEHKEVDGSITITYRVAPIIYEDLEKIIDEFKQNGILVLKVGH